MNQNADIVTRRSLKNKMKINYQEFFECKHEGDYGAVILITNEQIVETINLYNGTGNHNETIKKIIADIYETQNMTFKEIMYVMANQIRIKLVSEHGIKLLAIEFKVLADASCLSLIIFERLTRDIPTRFDNSIAVIPFSDKISFIRFSIM